MDRTREFVRMCREAKQLQELRPVGEFYKEGDYFVTNYEGGEEIEYQIAHLCTCTIKQEPITKRRQESDIWIPRWDQMGELVRFYQKGNSKSFFSYLASSFNLAGKAKNRHWFDTPDKHILSFIMNENHNMIWDLDEEAWVSTYTPNENTEIKYYDGSKWIEKTLDDTV